MIQHNQTRNQVFLMLILTLVVFHSLGQGINRGQDEQVTIRGSYDPTINQAFKINSKPETFSPTLKIQEFSFQSIEVDQPTNVTLEPIESTKIRADRKAKTYNNYLKAGIGSWISPYIDFTHSSGSKDAQFSANLYHLSSFKNIDNYSPSPNSNTQINIGWDKMTKTHVFSIGADYQLKTNRFYGFKPDDFPNIVMDEDNLNQMFNLIRTNIGLKSNYKKESQLHHSFKIGAYYYFDRFNSSETNALFEFDLHKAFNVTKLLNFQHLGLEGKVEYFGNTDSIQSNTDIFFEGTPYFKAKYGIVNFNIGLKFGYLSSDNSVFAFNPVIKVDLNVIPEGLTIYAGIDGGLEKNSLLRLTSANPWMALDTSLKWQNNRFDIYGGIRGSIARQLGFNLNVRYIAFEDMAFFINTSESVTWGGPLFPQNKFLTTYDDGNVFRFSGELTYSLGGNLKLWLNGEYNIYKLDSLKKAYHKPISFMKLGGSYLIRKKVNLWLETMLYGERFAVNNETLFKPTELTIDGFVDLNFGISYFISDNFSVWLSGTNLLNSNYERFYNYPVQGLEIMGGIGIRF